MSFDLHIPEDSQRGQFIQLIVADQQITAEEALTRIFDEGLKATLNGRETPTNRRTAIDEAMSDVRTQYPTYASLSGSVKGPGAHGSKEAVEKYISQTRNEW